MSFFKKLHIKILSVALLVTLISYNGHEVHQLPQQFTSECIVAASLSEHAVCNYKSSSICQSPRSEAFLFDFKTALNSFNTRDQVRFKMSSFKDDLLKKTRQNPRFLTQLTIASKEVHASII